MSCVAECVWGQAAAVAPCRRLGRSLQVWSLALARWRRQAKEVSTVMKLTSLDQLRLDGGTQPRASIDEALVEEYAEAIEGGAEIPPVVAFFDGNNYWLAD